MSAIGIWVKKCMQVGGAPAALAETFGSLLNYVSYSQSKKQIQTLSIVIMHYNPYTAAERRESDLEQLTPTRMVFRIMKIVWKYKWRPAIKWAFSRRRLGSEKEQAESDRREEEKRLEAIDNNEMRRLIYHSGPMFGVDWDNIDTSYLGVGKEVKKKKRRRKRRRRRKRSGLEVLLGVLAFAYVIMLFIIYFVTTHYMNKFAKQTANDVKSLTKRVDDLEWMNEKLIQDLDALQESDK